MNNAQLDKMLNHLKVASMLKHANKSKISYGNLQPVTASEFCKHNCITLQQLNILQPDYKELQLLIPIN
jgi:hypothetical protein